MKLISNELKSLINEQGQSGTSINVNVYGGTTGYDYSNPANLGQINNINGSTKNLIFAYLKRRIFAIIYIVVVLVLLLMSSVFTDLGFNIGQMIFNAIKSFLGY